MPRSCKQVEAINGLGSGLVMDFFDVGDFAAGLFSSWTNEQVSQQIYTPDYIQLFQPIITRVTKLINKKIRLLGVFK